MLAGALERAAGGDSTRVALTGPVGIGITTLLDELTTRLAEVPEVVVCRGRCLPTRSGLAYAALADALGRPLAALADEELATVVGPAAHDLAALLPELADRLAAAGLDSSPPALIAPEQVGARVQEALIGVVDRLARRGVACLVLEDLEHCDPATRDFVGALLRLSRRLPLLLILAYHPDELSRRHPVAAFARSIEASPLIEHIRLEPLGRDALAELAEAWQGERPTLGLAAALHEGSGGNPLLAGQMLAARGAVEGLRLSDPLDEMIGARIAPLPPQALTVLRLLAAARRPLDEDALLGLRTEAGRPAPRAVEAAIESGLARRSADSVEIVHPLVAEAIESLAVPAERQLIHATLAELLVGQPAEAAWHWDRSRRPRRARAAHLAAAGIAERLDPGGTALLHYQRALELADGDEATLAAASRAAEAAGAFRRAAGFIEQAIGLRTGGNLERFNVTRRQPAERTAVGAMFEALGRSRRAAGDATAGREAFTAAVRLTPAGAGPARARALASLAQDLMLEGRFEQSAAFAGQAQATATAAGHAALAELGHATCTLGVDVAYQGELERGLALLEQATEHSRAAGRLDDVMRAYANRTTLLDLDARREAALAVVRQGIAEAERNGLGLTYGAFLRGNAADILFQLGRWPEAEQECRAALEFPPAGVAWFSPLLYLSLVLVESRADEEAARLVGQTLLQLEAVPGGQWSALAQRVAVSLALWRGDTDDARQAAATGWQRVLETGEAGQIAFAAATVLEACAASADAGRTRRNWAALADAGALAERVLSLAEARLAAGELDRRLGSRREAELYLATARAHAARVRGRDTPEAWGELAHAWLAVPVPYQAAKAHWWQASAALQEAAVGRLRSRRLDARRAVLAGLEIAAQLPALPLGRALVELAARGSLALPPTAAVESATVAEPLGATPVGAISGSNAWAAGNGLAARLAGVNGSAAKVRFGLSPREFGVLQVLAEGRTNREIGERLFISDRTVAIHVRRILAKLGVAGRVEATAVAIRLGLVPGDVAPLRLPREPVESATIN
jgi:DNA-binding CsgD family transcriptional regulator/tetratricopeptide (TPR) repeat protein